MAITNVTNDYQIPRGRVYIDLWDDNGAKTGERALGNCPGLTLEITTEKAEHYSSETGLRQKDKSIVLQVDRTGTLMVDNMSLENVALFFSGATEAISQSADTGLEEITVIQDRIYQLGVSETAPTGVRDVHSVVVTDGAEANPVTYDLTDDYELDAALGRLRIVPGGAIATSGAETIEVSYGINVNTWDQATTGAVSELTCSLRIVADNASGANRDYYLPKCSLLPSGSLPIIAEGTDFASMEFTIDVLKPENAEAIYLDGRPAAYVGEPTP